MGVDITLLAKWLLFHISLRRKLGRRWILQDGTGYFNKLTSLRNLTGVSTHTKDVHGPESMRFSEDIYPYAD